MTAAGRAEIRSIYRSLIKTGRTFADYNIREYVKRRTKDAFRQNRTLTDRSAIASAIIDAKTQLDIAKRQAIVYSLYAPSLKNVMELKITP